MFFKVEELNLMQHTKERCYVFKTKKY